MLALFLESNSWCLIHHVSMSMENEREAAYSLLLGYKRPFKFKCHKGASCMCIISKIIKIAFVFVLCLCWLISPVNQYSMYCAYPSVSVRRYSTLLLLKYQILLPHMDGMTLRRTMLSECNKILSLSILRLRDVLCFASHTPTTNPLICKCTCTSRLVHPFCYIWA